MSYITPRRKARKDRKKSQKPKYYFFMPGVSLFFKLEI